MSRVAATTTPLTPARRAVLGRRAQVVAGASVAYNVVEAVVAIAAGAAAGSIALIGFGLDSVVEVFSGVVILWQFRHAVPRSRERRALRLIALSFFGLAAYVGAESVRALLGQAEVDTSRVGIGLAVASLLVMPFLSWAQRRTGRQLGSGSVVADGTQTLLCTYLSGVLLLGLVLNATLGWSWADPVAGLVVAAVAVKEGVEAWRGDGCCAPVLPGASAVGADAGPDGCSDRCAPGAAGGPAPRGAPVLPGASAVGADAGPDGCSDRCAPGCGSPCCAGGAAQTVAVVRSTSATASSAPGTRVK